MSHAFVAQRLVSNMRVALGRRDDFAEGRAVSSPAIGKSSMIP
jgi:hypothetical protein